jgi:hypothetical protein
MIPSIPSRGSHLADLTLWRDADGKIIMSVTNMRPELIETTGEEVGDRLKIIADWAVEGAIAMSETFDV